MGEILMAFPLGAAIGGAATLLGGLAANRSSAKSAERATKASSDEAAKSRAHQLYMSNTAYQRAKSDLASAGYNPILGMFQGGASTGSGSSAAGVASKFDNVGEGTANSALATRRLSADLDKIKADTELSEAMRKASDADVLLKGASTAKTLQEAKKLGFDTSTAEFKSWPHRMFNLVANKGAEISDAFAKTAYKVPKTSDAEWQKAHPKGKIYPFGVRIRKKGE